MAAAFELQSSLRYRNTDWRASSLSCLGPLEGGIQGQGIRSSASQDGKIAAAVSPNPNQHSKSDLHAASSMYPLLDRAGSVKGYRPVMEAPVMGKCRGVAHQLIPR